MDFGGKGANQCIAAQKLGADTGFVGCVRRHKLLYYLPILCPQRINITYFIRSDRTLLVVT